jgi:hypothetical protein
MNQVWSVATNSAVKGYFLDRAGDKNSTGYLAGAMRRLDAALSAYRNRKPRKV